MINVCYCGNRRIFSMVLLSVLSIMKYTTEPLSVYLFTMDCTDLDPVFLPVTEEQRKILEAVLKEGNPQNEAILVRADDEYNAVLRGGKNEKNYYTPYTLLRLLLTKFDLPSRLLYLDIDVMCCSDLTQLTDTDITDYEFAAVRDHMGKHFYGRDYFNAGVMYFNLDKIKETGLMERACDMVKTKKLLLNDQHALNKCATCKLLLDRRFNEQREIHADTVLKHFCRGIKWTPFFHVYNIKQTERDKVHKKLKIFMFDDIYSRYDEIVAAYGLERR